MNYWDDVSRHVDYDQIWMAHPLVRAAINRRVSGDPHVWPVAALKRRLGKTIGPVLSIGCGLGGLERSLVEEQISYDVTGIDVSETALEEARRAAGSMPIRYIAADARDFLREKSFDAIFFHQSMHHFDCLDALMDLVARSLRPGGFLWYDEYVGPSRNEWNLWKLLPANIAYYRLPSAMRRPHLIRAPINREDPTEAIASSKIMAATERRFRIVDRRDYGGGLLAILYPNLRTKPDHWIARLIEWDARRPSFYTIVIAEPRQ
ncbi:MAG TPA: class I SAM-dependent methyltransferase [Thermoanaerobaculia bacterium]|nr:class I SAM-dependent methyltransferase [Thermoanaerobaculia bacterium]